MSDRDVMKQALEALERARPQIRGVLPSQDADAAITNLRARLAEPEPQTCKPALQVEGAEAVAFNTCPTCQSLARAVMLDQTGKA